MVLVRICCRPLGGSRKSSIIGIDGIDYDLFGSAPGSGLGLKDHTYHGLWDPIPELSES